MKNFKDLIALTFCFLILSWTLSLSGCGAIKMNNVIELNDDNIEAELSQAKVPVVLYIHRGDNSYQIEHLGPMLDRFAMVYPDRFIFAHYNVEKNKVWIGKRQAPKIGTLHLFENGIEISSIQDFSSNQGIIKETYTSLVFSLLSKHIVPEDALRFSEGASSISSLDFQKKTAEAKGPVIIAFEDSKASGRRESFNPDFFNLSRKYGRLAKFYTGDDFDLLLKCGMKKAPSLCIYVDGQQVRKYEGELYKAGGNTHVILYELLPFMAYSDALFKDD